MIVTALTFVAMLAVGIWLLSSVDENQQIVSNLTQTQLGELALKLEFFASEWTAVSWTLPFFFVFFLVRFCVAYAVFFVGALPRAICKAGWKPTCRLPE